ncbi:MAG: 2,3-bisphosphoglycerate-independent phosphoglycerate mutase [Chitinophagaceae bacterium]
MSKQTLLIILDGWGHGKIKSADATQHAHIPYIKNLYNKYSNSELMTCGEYVGLPDGQMGNSEVGHLNIGAGRIVYQELQRINVAIKQGEFGSNEEIIKCISYCKSQKKPLHLMGLVSDGGVHSHINHLFAILDTCVTNDFKDVYIHCFTDGRDTDPNRGIQYLAQLQAYIDKTCGKIASITGRYYAMDRDKRWERVKIAYDALVNAKGEKTNAFLDAIQKSYGNGVSDEFLKPIICTDDQNNAVATIQEGDAVFCFNYRTDRCREITQVLTQQAIEDQGMKPMSLYYLTMTEYDKTYQGIHVIFRNDDLNNTLGEVLAKHHKTQIRIAETEKYPHVTFFFSGGREKEFEGERRLMAASPKDVATYDLKPQMSAEALTALILPEIEKNSADFICLNFANPDMVGHTGVWEAVIKALETVDHCVSQIIPLALAKGYTIFLTADHGNSDYMINDDGSPNTAHTLNPVPFFIIAKDFKGPIQHGILADIARTILHFMNIPIPKEMTGKILS